MNHASNPVEWPPMKYYYAEAKQSMGPVEDSFLHDLALKGVVSGDTLVWAEGMENWQPYKVVFPGRPIGEPTAKNDRIPARSPSPAPSEPTTTASNNPYTVAPSLTRMQSGSPDLEALVERSYKVEIGRLFSLAWAFFTKDFWLLMGAGAVMSLIHTACGQIPLLGLVTSLFYLPFFSGVYYFYIRYTRAENPPFEMIFSGFSRLPGQIIMLNIMYIAVSILCLLPSGLLFLGGLMGEQEALLILAGVALLIGVVAMLILYSAWIFSVLLTIDKGLFFSPGDICQLAGRQERFLENHRVQRSLVLRRFFRVSVLFHRNVCHDPVLHVCPLPALRTNIRKRSSQSQPDRRFRSRSG